MILNHNLYAPLYSLLKPLFSSAPHVPRGLLNAATNLSRRQPLALGWHGRSSAFGTAGPGEQHRGAGNAARLLGAALPPVR